jgi:hypothetical protein
LLYSSLFLKELTSFFVTLISPVNEAIGKSIGQDGQNFFQGAIPKFTILNFDVLVYRISGIVAEDCQIVLSKSEQQNILNTIFSGINEYKN